MKKAEIARAGRANLDVYEHDEEWKRGIQIRANGRLGPWES